MVQTIMDGYVRVSRVDGREGDSYISPDVQREAIERWAEYHDVTIAEWHVDEDWSGGTHDRPGLNLAINRALAGQTQGIVSWKLDRFSRNTEAALHDLKRLQDQSARLAFVVEDIDTGTPHGRMIYTILLAVSEAFLESVKAGWKITQTKAMERGALVGPTPYGYRRNEDGTISPDPEAAPIVAKTFQLAADRNISHAYKFFKEHRPDLNVNYLRRIIGYRIYLGEQHYGEHHYTDAHEAIVTLDVWERAQEPDYVPKRTTKRYSYPLRGIATCACCGSLLVGGGSQNYFCRTATSTYRGDRCASPTRVKASMLDDYLINLLADSYDAAGRTTLLVAEEGEQVDLAPLKFELDAARAEQARFVADPVAAELLGEQEWREALRTRFDRVSAAQAAYDEAATASRQTSLDIAPEALRSLPTEDLEPIFRAVFANVIVSRRSNGLKLPDRLKIITHSDARRLA